MGHVITFIATSHHNVCTRMAWRGISMQHMPDAIIYASLLHRLLQAAHYANASVFANSGAVLEEES